MMKINSIFSNLEFMITGGSGSLGNALTKILCEKYDPKGIRIYSRGEMLQYEMKKAFVKYNTPISYLIGDVRDLKRLKLAMKGVDIVIHAAAMKQITACNNNPIEAIETNIYGAQNVILSAIENRVKKVVNISTDKAVLPWTLYGSTKMSAEKLFINANTYCGGREPIFSSIRYGNIANSRGSVIPLWKNQAKTGRITVTNSEMTRFFMTLPDVAQFILDQIPDMEGGEIFIPHMNSVKIIDLAKMIAPEAYIKTIGIRNDEKLHEVLIAPNEMKRTYFNKIFDYYMILPEYVGGREIKYESNNPKFLKPAEFFRSMI